MIIRLAEELTFDSIVDGEGLRNVIWTQGCKHNCLWCHNPQTHSMDSGFIRDCDSFINYMIQWSDCRNVTFSGGDPFEQSEACAYIAKRLKEAGFNIWAYSGYTFEQLISDNSKMEFLQYVDVLVDGKFDMSKLDTTLPFRGSKNQRIINVASSLESDAIIIIKK